MIKFPLPNGWVFAVIEPSNIEKLKLGLPLVVDNVMIAFTPNIEAFASKLGVHGLPEKGKTIEYKLALTPEKIDSTLKECQKLPEVLR